jgi:hypothetical protein
MRVRNGGDASGPRGGSGGVDGVQAVRALHGHEKPRRRWGVLVFFIYERRLVRALKTAVRTWNVGLGPDIWAPVVPIS